MQFTSFSGTRGGGPVAASCCKIFYGNSYAWRLYPSIVLITCPPKHRKLYTAACAPNATPKTLDACRARQPTANSGFAVGVARSAAAGLTTSRGARMVVTLAEVSATCVYGLDYGLHDTCTKSLHVSLLNAMLLLACAGPQQLAQTEKQSLDNGGWKNSLN